MDRKQFKDDITNSLKKDISEIDLKIKELSQLIEGYAHKKCDLSLMLKKIKTDESVDINEDLIYTFYGNSSCTTTHFFLLKGIYTFTLTVQEAGESVSNYSVQLYSRRERIEHLFSGYTPGAYIESIEIENNGIYFLKISYKGQVVSWKIDIQVDKLLY